MSPYSCIGNIAFRPRNTWLGSRMSTPGSACLRITLITDAITAGSIRLEGDDDARPLFSRWFGLSPFADGGAERILAGVVAR